MFMNVCKHILNLFIDSYLMNYLSPVDDFQPPNNEINNFVPTLKTYSLMEHVAKFFSM